MIRGHRVIDTHIHIVPGVDDGARTVEEAVEMLRMEQMQGVDVVFATPHSMAFDHNSDRVWQSFENLKLAAAKAEVNMELWLGCEMFCHPGNISECIRKLNEGIYPSFGQYVLTEFPAYGFGIKDALYCVMKLQDAGYCPVIAHAERYEFSDFEAIELLRSIPVIQK